MTRVFGNWDSAKWDITSRPLGVRYQKRLVSGFNVLSGRAYENAPEKY